MSLDQVSANRAGEVPNDIPVYVICRSGNRSVTASRILADAGKEVINVKGGILAWQGAGYAVVQ
ncbi:MAG: rhodanese-like domain-containing protein [Deinococcales bacterium]